MEILSEQQILDRIRKRHPFSARATNGGLEVRIARYLPMVVTAIHDGHRVSGELANKMLVDGDQRQFEEDPYTGAIAESFDISIKVIDSRYCGDLNRPPERCIYEEAWGHQVWKEPLDVSEKQQLLESHAGYYRILDELLAGLTRNFGRAVLYDLHSYNYRRLEGTPPLFNIGTHFIDMQRFGGVVDHLVTELATIDLAGCDNRAALDEVFRGRGYQAEYIHAHHHDVLCVPLEIKKVFIDEESFELKEEIYAPLREAMIGALTRNHEVFLINSRPKQKVG